MPFKQRRHASPISATAHHTGYVWVKNGLSHPALATRRGRAGYCALAPLMFFSHHALGRPDLNTRLLQRHRIIDYVLTQAVSAEGVSRVLELASGLSGRGLRFAARYPEIAYFEADLPDMADLKRGMLSRAGLLAKNLRVLPCDILAGNGETSLEAVAGRVFSPGRPAAVITEGLIHYFPFPVIARLWERIAGALRSAGGGVYITDVVLDPDAHRALSLAGIWNAFLGRLARTTMQVHFKDEDQARQGFRAAGFSRVEILRPEDFQGDPDIPRSRRPSISRVAAAWV